MLRGREKLQLVHSTGILCFWFVTCHTRVPGLFIEALDQVRCYRSLDFMVTRWWTSIHLSTLWSTPARWDMFDMLSWKYWETYCHIHTSDKRKRVKKLGNTVYVTSLKIWINTPIYIFHSKFCHLGNFKARLLLLSVSALTSRTATINPRRAQVFFLLLLRCANRYKNSFQCWLIIHTGNVAHNLLIAVPV